MGSQIKKGVVLNYINIGLGNIIPLFYTPVMLSILGKSEYGLYRLSSMITGYVSLVSLGLGSAVTRYLIKANKEGGREEEERMLGLFICIFRVIAVIALCVGIVLALNVGSWYNHSLSSPEIARMRILIIIMVINMALGFTMAPFLSDVVAHESFVFNQSVNIVLTCGIPIANIIVLLLGYASVGMAISSLIIQLIARMCYVVYVNKVLEIHPRYDNMPVGVFKEILLFSFWIFVGTIVDQLYNATDIVLIGAIPRLSTTGVAVYSIGTVFSGMVLTLSIGLSSILIPKTNKMVFDGANGSELTDFGIRVGRIQALMVSLVVSGFIVFGKPFIHFYVGDSYYEAYWVAILIILPSMIPLVQNIFLNVIIASNKHRFRSIVYLVIAIVNVVFSWLILQRHGIIGAAFVTGAAMIIGQGLIMNWYYRKKIGLEISRFWKEIGTVFICPALLAAIFLLISRYCDVYRISSLIIGILLYTVCYLAINWFFVMNAYEKSLISSLLSIRYE